MQYFNYVSELETFCECNSVANGDYFITIQPNSLYDKEQLHSLVNGLLIKHNLTAINITETDYKRNYKTAHFLNSFHSHIIVKESIRLSAFYQDAIQLMGEDIVDKEIYYLPGLIQYLSKQATKDKLQYTCIKAKRNLIPVPDTVPSETVPLTKRKRLTFTDIILTSHFLTSFSAIRNYLLETPLHLSLSTMAHNQRFTQWLSISNNLLPPCRASGYSLGYTLWAHLTT